jgi:hypothetical protein
MSFLARSSNWSNVQLWMFKLCAFCAGVAMGIYFVDMLKQYLIVFVMLFVITVIPVLAWWIKKNNVS